MDMGGNDRGLNRARAAPDKELAVERSLDPSGGRTTVDLYQSHGTDASTHAGGNPGGALGELVRAGKVRFIGSVEFLRASRAGRRRSSYRSFNPCRGTSRCSPNTT